MNVRTNIDYKMMIDHLATAVLIVNGDLTVHYMNSSCETLFEISYLRIHLQPIAQFIELNDSHFTFTEALKKTLHTYQPYTHREALLSIGLKDRYVDYTVSLLPTSAQHPDPLLLIEFQSIDRLLRISKDDLQDQQHQVARQLIRSMAHEIKNPLGGIRGATQLLARNVKDPHINEYTEIIINEVDRLRNLADTMLGSRQLPSYEPVNIHEPLERVRSLVLSQTKNKIPVLRDYDLSLPDIIADRDQLIQVILNISVNAVQAMTENKAFYVDKKPQLIFRTRIQRLVTIQGVHHRSAVRVDIEDNGPGIPPEIIESVFYPMVTGRANGTGLGLSIAQNIMRQHQGMIECNSEVGRTIFSLYLPWENKS
ncbi:PAS domain-containing sensor histidine kinase [Acinetobacter qingfengensis]|uniref:histidine kinase n=1 Tax=Acinetobacter qingfengensis TaxID=1262585 RepID=A0A1E7RED9_9GAMM|nr:nitrogen regulation protein NR(II) [Acinetobacter qingfengensis]KAA8734394.1 PAS domain-containing sensor histidine kinase [Acinetobacter qingfengensis]OEY97597.1 PAS domain-containing sensor histidine kinase [Acinetobacter qingfengensis]